MQHCSSFQRTFYDKGGRAIQIYESGELGTYPQVAAFVNLNRTLCKNMPLYIRA